MSRVPACPVREPAGPCLRQIGLDSCAWCKRTLAWAYPTVATDPVVTERTLSLAYDFPVPEAHLDAHIDAQIAHGEREAERAALRAGPFTIGELRELHAITSSPEATWHDVARLVAALPALLEHLISKHNALRLAAENLDTQRARIEALEAQLAETSRTTEGPEKHGSSKEESPGADEG